MSRRPSSTQPKPVRRAGALCAAFVNTARRGRRARSAGSLATWSDLLAWGSEFGVLDAAARERLERLAVERPAYAEAGLLRVEEIRALAERILLALASGLRPDPADVDALVDDGLARSRRRLVPAGRGYRWVWRHGDDLDHVLGQVLLSVVEVLTSEDHRRVRVCGGADCELVFVDRTPGSPRRWCGRRSCGDRSRSRRRYHKTVKPRRKEGKRRRQERRSRVSRRDGLAPGGG